MLVYHPAQDVYHCCYRLLNILLKREQIINIDYLKIIDFYVVFPHLLKEIKIPQNLISHKRNFKIINEPYEKFSSNKRLVFELSSLQENAIKFLVAQDIFQLEIDSNSISVKKENIPIQMKEYLSENSYSKLEWFQSMLIVFDSLELGGSEGLKARTGLMEYRYDA